MTLANWCLSNKTNGLICAQQISHHIQELQNHKLINVEISGGRRRAISCNSIDYTDPKPSFTPIVGLAETELTPSDTLILSMLANYACIYARSNIGFSLPEPTVVGVGKQLANTKALSTTSYHRALEGLMESEALDYIARNGSLDFLDRDGNRLDRIAQRNLIKEWCDDQDVPKSEAEITGRRAADARRMIISCPAGTDPEKVMAAAQQFGQKFLRENGFDYVCALHCHSPEHPNEPEHPHVHFSIKTINQDEQRLNVRKNDLKFMRERFAAIAKEHGIIMNATPRAIRGKTEKAKPLEQIHQERREAAAVKSNDQAPANPPYKEARDQR